MTIKDEMDELQQRIAQMRALLRNVTDQRAVQAIQDIIADANRTLESLLQRKRGSKAWAAAIICVYRPAPEHPRAYD